MEHTPKIRFFTRWFAIIGLAFMLAACGFHLRGDFKYDFSSMYIEGGSAMSRLMKRYNRGMQATKIVDNPKEAEVILAISQERRKQKTLSYDNNGDAREYALYYRVTYALRTLKGKELIEPTTITLRRTMTYDDSEDLAKEREKQLLYADMQQDIVQQMMRRLARVDMDDADRRPVDEDGEVPEEGSAQPDGSFKIQSDEQ